MPVRITNRDHFLDYFNGKNFDLNTSDTAKHLHGNVLNKSKILFDISVSWETESSLTVTFVREGDLISRSSGSFIADQFAIGDVVDVKAIDTDGATINWSALNVEVTAVEDDFIIIDGMELQAPNEDGDYGSGSSVDNLDRIEINGKTQPTALIMNFGLIGNDSNISFNSPLDGSLMGYYAVDVGLGGSTTPVDASPYGQFRSSYSGSMTVAYVDTSIDGYTFNFQVSHIIRNIPHYLEGQKDDIINNDPPEPFNGESIKYVSRHEFRTVANDANTAKYVEDQNKIGSVGYYGQNYNGQIDNFAISNLTYEDSGGDPLPSLSVGQLTTVKFRVTSIEDSFVNGSSIIQAHASYLAPETEYQKSTSFFDEVFELEDFRDTLGNDTTTGQTIIQNVKSDFVDINNIDVELKVLYSSKNSDDSYVLSIDVSTEGISSGNSDLVNKVIDCNTFDKSACILDLLYLTKMTIEDYQTDNINKYGGMIEDGILLNVEMQLNHEREASLTSASVMIIAFNESQGTMFPILTETIPFQTIANKTDAYQYQEITTEQNIGYKLESADKFGLRSITTGDLSGDLRTYFASIGVKIPWQSWEELIGADEEFTDINEPNNGLNKDSSRYQDHGYELRAVVKFDVSGLDDLGAAGSSSYFFSKIIDVDSYTSGVIFQTFDVSNNSEISGGLLNNADTAIKVTVPSTLGTFNTNYIGILRFEPKETATDRAIYEHNETEIKANYADNAFSGVLTKSLVSSDLVFESELKGEYVEEKTDYKLSLRLICPGTICFVFKTNMNAPIDGPFDPKVQIFTGLDDFEWKLPSETLYGASISTNDSGLDGTIQNVSLCTEDLTKIESIDMNDIGLYGDFDVTQLINTYSFGIQTNPDLTNFTIGSGVDVQYIHVGDCNITDFDLSSRAFNGTNLLLNGNNNLISVDFGDNDHNSTGSISFANCNLPTLDLTKWLTLGALQANNNINLSTILINHVFTITQSLSFVGTSISSFDWSNAEIISTNFFFSLASNTNLTTINNPTTNGVFSTYSARSCNLTGTLDMSGLTGLSGGVFLYTNPLLANVILPIGTETISSLLIYSCSLISINILDMPNMTNVNNGGYNLSNNGATQSQTDKFADDFDAISNGSYIGRTLFIQNNSIPSAAGLISISSLQSKGFTVTYDT